MKSMTGFGRGEANSIKLGIGFRTEISSVNRKQFEIKLNLPREVSQHEPRLRMMVSEKVSRGSIMLRVDIEGGAASGAAQSASYINKRLASELASRCQELQESLGLQGTLQIGQLLSLPGVIEARGLDFSMPEIEELLYESVENAMSSMVKMREVEGLHLKADIETRLKTLSELVDEIEPLTRGLPEIYRERLLVKLKKADLPLDPSDERILRELVIFADKSDVSEEITRLRSHFVHFKKFLDSKDASVGRSLDFMIQEILRETTTLGNKATNSEISPLIVQLKTELEKIREQVQNIE